MQQNDSLVNGARCYWCPNSKNCHEHGSLEHSDCSSYVQSAAACPDPCDQAAVTATCAADRTVENGLDNAPGGQSRWRDCLSALPHSPTPFEDPGWS